MVRADRPGALAVAHAEPAAFELRLEDEAGRVLERAGRTSPRRGRVAMALPRLAPGAWRATLRLGSEGGARELSHTLWAAPARCPTPAERLGRRRAFGLWANLYAVRGERGLGIGHLGDLAALARLTGRAGGDFVGVNPLHALRNRGAEISPYAPVTRLFRNPLCLDVDAVPELAASAEARRLLASARFRRELAALRAARHVDYERSARLLAALLPPLHRAFRAHASPARRRAFARHRAEAGPALDAFARFLVLEARFAAAGLPRDWRRWPAEYRAPGAAAVKRLGARQDGALERHAYVQFELDRQLANAAREARRGGLAIGLYTDLAIGSAPSGFDAWAYRPLFVPGVEVGAPPDAYNRAGQAWGFAPLHPGRLGQGGFGFFARLLRANLRHAGALRIDHVLGLFRQWWIPPGAAPDAGAYVRFPARALLGLVALEARRAGALVIGEDLGTVPAEVPAALARHGVLSSRVMLFERTRGGGFRPARRYSPRALVTASTHDLPTLAGWFAARDLAIRRALGLLGPRAYPQACRERRRECAALLARLRRDGHLERSARALAPEERLAAVHRFLCATPAPLVGVSLEDLALEEEPVNVPGVAAERHPSWTRRLRVPLALLARSRAARVALAGAASRARRPGS